MNAVKSVRKSIAHAFVIGILVFAGLAAMLNVFVLEGNVSVVPVLDDLGAAEGTPTAVIESAPSGTRGLNEDGDNYVDLDRDINGDPNILIDGGAPGVNDVYIGEPNIQLDIPVRSIKPENDTDRDGDDILYNVSVSIDSASTTMWSSEGCCWVDASNYINWDTEATSPNFKDDGFNRGNALLIEGGGLFGGGQYYKYIPWFYDDYGPPGFLDKNNDQRSTTGEYCMVNDSYKTYEGFQFDVDGKAPAGTYNISVEITYKYQTFQNVSNQRLTGGVGSPWYDPDTGQGGNGPSGCGDLGIFNYYFWEPYDIGNPTASVNFNDYLNVGFRKRADYRESAALPSGAYWEAIPDLGYDADNPDGYTTQGGNWDYDSNYDGDVSSWNDGDTGANLTEVANRWEAWQVNEYTTAGAWNSYWQRTADQYPYDLDTANGTWECSGYEAETIWTEEKTEIEYIEFQVEHAIRLREPAGDGCELVPDNMDPFYLKAGDEFKKMFIQINNRDSSHHMTDVYVNISLDNPEYFTLKHDWAWKNQVNAGADEYFYYRIYAKNGTPVDRYWGNVTLTYTREGIRVTEEMPIELILYFTPNLRNHGGLPYPALEVSQTIHTGQPETQVDFSIKNVGNTLLENGILTMDFSNFKHKGDEYTDPEGGEGTYSQQIEIPSISCDQGTDTHDVSVDVEIPHHWSLLPGVYKLLMDYEGYYFNDGVIGEPTNYVKLWMDWYDDDADPTTDMNAYCIIDSDGDETMDIFTNDETRPIEGIYMYIEVEEFVPNKPELKVTDVSINGGTDTFEQGSISNCQVTLTLTNSGESNISDLEVELDLQGYFKGLNYYEGYANTVENPIGTLKTLNMAETGQVTLDIKGIDKYLPPGVHRLKLNYQYNYDNGSLPSELSTETGEVYFNITVTDSAPDVVPTVSSNTGIIRIGSKLVDINLYVNLANKEYYDISHVTGTLTVGDDTPFIPGENATVSGAAKVVNKWNNPATNSIPATGQNLNNMYFNLNLHPNAKEGTYYLELVLELFNERTMETIMAPTTLEVKIYPKIAKLRIIDVAVSTGRVTPGKEFTLDVTIQNDGGESARDIYVEFQEAYVSGDAVIETYESINPTGAKYPFSSDIIKAYIAEIQPQSTGLATFTVRGDLNIYPGVTYFQNIEFNYKDSTGNDHTTLDVAPINSDSSIKATVDGEKYVWDTDRESWISQAELESEKKMDYMPWMITAAIIVWLVTLLIIFFFIIRPRYKKDKLKTKGEPAESSETELPYTTEETSDDAMKSVQETKGPKHPEEEEEDQHNVLDYRNGPEASTPLPPPPPPALPPPPATPTPAATPTAAEPVKSEEETPEPSSEPTAATTIDETETKEEEDKKPEEDKEEESKDEPPKAEPISDTDKETEGLPKKGPKNK